MAKIKTSALIAQIRNSIGNTTFTVNRYGPVARSKVAPIQPRTARQLAVRADFTTASKAWAGLTTDQQAAWVAFAAAHPISDVFGDSRILAGNAAYLAANATRAIVGLDPVATPAPTGGAAPALDSALTATGATGVVEATTAAQDVTTGWYVISTTPGLSNGVYFAGSMLRTGGFVATVAAAVVADVTPATFNPTLGFLTGQIVIATVSRVDINGYVVSTNSYRVVAV